MSAISQSESSVDEPWEHLVRFLKPTRQPGAPYDVFVRVRDRPLFEDNPVNFALVRISGYGNGVFIGTVIKSPRELGPVFYPSKATEIEKGSTIHFVLTGDRAFPIMVSKTYLSELRAWKVTPCPRCASTQLFDTPSELIEAICLKFWSQSLSDRKPVSFLTCCYLCGGSLMVYRL